MRMTRSKWFMPAFCVALGVACLAAFWLGGNRNQGLFSLALFAAIALVFALGGRSETVRGLRHGEVIRTAIRDRRNILIVGSTGSGKTTLVNAILEAVARISPSDRVITWRF